MTNTKGAPARRLGLALAACAATALPLAACSSGSSAPSWAAKLGSGVTVTAPQSVSSGNGSPGAAAYGYITALISKDPAAACAYVEPGFQGQCSSGLKSITPSQLGVSAKNAAIGWGAIDGTKALVGRTGTFCAKNSTPQCFTNTDPAALLDSGKSFNDLWIQALAAQSASNADNVSSLGSVIEVNGKWYVDIQTSS